MDRGHGSHSILDHLGIERRRRPLHFLRLLPSECQLILKPPKGPIPPALEVELAARVARWARTTDLRLYFRRRPDLLSYDDLTAGRGSEGRPAVTQREDSVDQPGAVGTVRRGIRASTGVRSP